MICETCMGDRTLPIFAVSGEQIGELPCPVCEGWGLSYCCTGECAEPDSDILAESSDDR